jgi:cobalamin biosynthesis protein CbiD
MTTGTAATAAAAAGTAAAMGELEYLELGSPICDLGVEEAC